MVQSLNKANQLWDQETKIIEAKNQTELSDLNADHKKEESDLQQKLVVQEKEEEKKEGEENEKNDLEVYKFVEIESRIFDPKKMSLISAAFILSLLIILVKGGKGIESIFSIQRCDIGDWLTTIIYLISCAVIIYLSYILLVSEGEQKMKAMGRKSMETQSPVLLLSAAFVIGFIAAMLGIGGAAILTPLLLSLDYSP